MGIEKKDEQAPDACEATPLAPGVWVTEATGFASVPPRAQSDLRDAKVADKAAAQPPEQPQQRQDAKKAAADDLENALMMARGEPECRGDEAEAGAHEPRIEKYRER